MKLVIIELKSKKLIKYYEKNTLARKMGRSQGKKGMEKGGQINTRRQSLKQSGVWYEYELQDRILYPSLYQSLGPRYDLSFWFLTEKKLNPFVIFSISVGCFIKKPISIDSLVERITSELDWDMSTSICINQFLIRQNTVKFIKLRSRLTTMPLFLVAESAESIGLTSIAMAACLVLDFNR